MKTNKFYLNALLPIALGLFACSQPKSGDDNSSDPNVISSTATDKLDTSFYEILAIKHNQAAQNFYVLYKSKKIDENSLNEFVTKFRAAFCENKCNIDLYDLKTLRDVIIKDSISNVEYLQLADHNIASSTFETPKVLMYPLQDIKYKKLGGTNWKKKHNF